MREKQNRIFDAAAELFAEYGFDAVTTQAISERADVASGTLFRYASSKAELLLMVYNEQLRQAIEAGRRAAEAQRDPAVAVVALVAPILTVAARDSANAVVYQRELLFGTADDRYRAEGLGIVTALENAIALRLREAVGNGGHDQAAVAVAAMRAARTIFAAVHLLIAQPATGAHRGTDSRVELEAQIAQVVSGFLTTVDAPGTAGKPRKTR